MKTWLILATEVVGLTAVTPAEARLARCWVAVEGRSLLDGPGEFRREDRDGSISISAVNSQDRLMANAGTMSIRVTKPGSAAVFVVQETSSSWGPAQRSKTDKACWIGASGSFKICAYRVGASVAPPQSHRLRRPRSTYSGRL